MSNQYAKAEAVIDDLLASHAEGESIASMAKRYGLRREAVSAVLAEHGVGAPSETRAAVLEYVRNNPGLSIDDLALRLDLSKSSVSRYVRGSEEARLVVSRKQTDLSTYSDQEMAAALRSVWRELEHKSKGLSRVRYNKMRTDEMPAASTYIRRYGSWSASCEKAGISASKPRRGNYSLEWSDEMILDALDEYEETIGAPPTYRGYALWAQEHGKPSGPSVLQRSFGSWSEARKKQIRRKQQTVAV